MHIRQLARNAALITVAAIVTAGFSTGIAQATSAAPTSTVSVSSVVHSGTAPRAHKRMASCPKYTFCAYGVAGSRELYLAQSFTCAESIHNAVSNTIYLMINNCTAHAVYHYYKSGGDGCVSASSQQGRSGGYPAIDYYYVAPWKNC